MLPRVFVALALFVTVPAMTSGQTLTADAYTPITGTGRAEWVVRGNVGPQSLGVGVFTSAWQTAFDTPEEWDGWNGFGRRFAQREAHVAMSNSIEAGLGSLWDEEPRYVRAPQGDIWSRTRYALKSSVMSRRADGTFTPAWGRYAGNVGANLIDNAWLPSSVTTGSATSIRIVNGVLGRMAGNVFTEFWPDVRARIRR